MREAKSFYNYQEGCIFCQISAHEAPAKVEYYDEDVISFHPLNPVTEDHLLVVPRRHARDFTDWPSQHHMAWYRASILAKRFDNVNLITSKGPEATQTVQHLHIHIVPRRAGDGLHLPWTGQEIG